MTRVSIISLDEPISSFVERQMNSESIFAVLIDADEVLLFEDFDEYSSYINSLRTD